jgi:hypothetical protein
VATRPPIALALVKTLQLCVAGFLTQIKRTNGTVPFVVLLTLVPTITVEPMVAVCGGLESHARSWLVASKTADKNNINFFIGALIELY